MLHRLWKVCFDKKKPVLPDSVMFFLQSCHHNILALVNTKTVCMCCRLRVPALHALPPATPSAGRSPHQSTRTLPARPRLTHLRTHSWAWEGMFRRPSLRVTQSHADACIRLWIRCPNYGWKLYVIAF